MRHAANSSRDEFDIIGSTRLSESTSGKPATSNEKVLPPGSPGRAVRPRAADLAITSPMLSWLVSDTHD